MDVGDADVLPVEATIWAGPAEQPRTDDNEEGPVMGVNNPEEQPIDRAVAPPQDLGPASVEDWLRSISQARSISARPGGALVESIAGPLADPEHYLAPANSGTWESVPEADSSVILDEAVFDASESLFELPELALDLDLESSASVPDLDSFGSFGSFGSPSFGSIAPVSLTDAQRTELGLTAPVAPTIVTFDNAPIPRTLSAEMEQALGLSTAFPAAPDSTATPDSPATPIAPAFFAALSPAEPEFGLDPIESNEFLPPPSIQVVAAPPGASVLFGDLASASPTVTSAFRQHLNDAAKAANPVDAIAPPVSPSAESLVHVPSSPADSPREIAVPTLPPLPTAVPKSQPSDGTSTSSTDRTANDFEVSPTVAKLPGTGSSVVAARRITKFRTIGSKQIEILNDVTLDLRAGHFIVITGASGSGKTTLLSCLAGIESFDRGELMFEGHSLTDLTESDRARHRAAAMGFVFQGFHLVGVLTAVENVELPLLVAGWSAAEARDEAIAALSLVGLAGRPDQLPDQLSGGEQQRVAIARALVGEPRIVFADEPTGNLDDASARKIAHLFHELHADGLTVVVASHDQRLMALATTIVDVQGGRVTERPGPRTIV
jgi:putative ABC transport system ATP-binding protein